MENIKCLMLASTVLGFLQWEASAIKMEGEEEKTVLSHLLRRKPFGVVLSHLLKIKRISGFKDFQILVFSIDCERGFPLNLAKF